MSVQRLIVVELLRAFAAPGWVDEMAEHVNGGDVSELVVLARTDQQQFLASVVGMFSGLATSTLDAATAVQAGALALTFADVAAILDP